MDWLNVERSNTFIQSLKAAKMAEISPWAVYAQACFETNFFKELKGSHNYFNFKSSKEVFGSWGNAQDSMDYYLEVIRRKNQKAVKCKNCAHCFIQGLNGWRGDKLYSRRVMSRYDFVRGEERITRAFNVFLEHPEV